MALTLKNSRRADFESSLKTWFERYQDFFNERTKNPETGQTRYTHPRLRSAYFSLKWNLDSLFVFEQYPELGIPNTTNLLDGTFSDMKRLLRCHQGMGKDGRIRFIKDYFSMSDAESHLFCYLLQIAGFTVCHECCKARRSRMVLDKL